ncbi:MAG: hypothetical protein IPK80_05400 [Nannocystis sp.]|nr:hypothetical protein [Nannocystis sp.]
MIESRDYILAVIERVAQALAALLADTARVAGDEDEDPEMERALDDLLAGLDAHAYRLDPATLMQLLRDDERALAFAVLQLRKGLRQREYESGSARIRCAYGLLLLLASRPGRVQAAAQPLVRALAALLDLKAPIAGR